MPHLTKSNKKNTETIKMSGRFASPEEAAKAKNADFISHIKKIGLQVTKKNIPAG